MFQAGRYRSVAVFLATLLVCAAGSLFAQSTVNFYPHDQLGNALTNLPILSAPVSGPFNEGSYMVGLPKKNLGLTSTNGILTVTNFQAGLYQITWQTEPPTVYVIQVPSGTNTYTDAQLTTNLAQLPPFTGLIPVVTNVIGISNQLLLETNGGYLDFILEVGNSGGGNFNPSQFNTNASQVNIFALAASNITSGGQIPLAAVPPAVVTNNQPNVTLPNVSSGPYWPNTIYLSVAGNDINAGTNILAPVATLTNALYIATNVIGGTNLIKAGAGVFALPPSIIWPNNIGLIGEGSNLTSFIPTGLNSSMTSPSAASNAFIELEGTNIYWRDFTIGTNAAQQWYYYAVKPITPSVVYFENIAFVGDSDCILQNTAGAGISGTIYHCSFNSSWDCFALTSGNHGTGGIIDDCTFISGYAGDWAGEPYTCVRTANVPGWLVKNCTFYQSNSAANNAYAIETSSSSGITVQNPTFYMTNSVSNVYVVPIEILSPGNGYAVGAMNPSNVTVQAGGAFYYDASQFTGLGATPLNGTNLYGSIISTNDTFTTPTVDGALVNTNGPFNLQTTTYGFVISSNGIAMLVLSNGALTATEGFVGNISGTAGGVPASGVTALPFLSDYLANGVTENAVVMTNSTATGSTFNVAATTFNVDSNSTFGGTATFTNPISGSVTGSAGSVAASGITGLPFTSTYIASNSTTSGTIVMTNNSAAGIIITNPASASSLTALTNGTIIVSSASGYVSVLGSVITSSNVSTSRAITFDANGGIVMGGVAITGSGWSINKDNGAVFQADTGTAVPLTANGANSSQTGNLFNAKSNSVLVAWIAANGSLNTSSTVAATNGFIHQTASQTVNLTCVASNDWIWITATTNTTNTLLTAGSYPGKDLTIKNVGSGPGGSAGIATITAGGSYIDGVTNLTLPDQWDYVKVAPNGTNWVIIGGETNGVPLF